MVPNISPNTPKQFLAIPLRPEFKIAYIPRFWEKNSVFFLTKIFGPKFRSFFFVKFWPKFHVWLKGCGQNLLGQTFGFRPKTFFAKIFGPKLLFLSKTFIGRNYCQIWVKNLTFGRKSKFGSKIEFFSKVIYFWPTLRFLTKSFDFLVKIDFFFVLNSGGRSFSWKICYTRYALLQNREMWLLIFAAEEVIWV